MKFAFKLIALVLFLVLSSQRAYSKAGIGDTCLLSCEDALARNIVKISKNYIGTPYKYGGISGSGFDCSGFVNYVFGKNKIPLQRSSSGIASSIAGDPVTLDEAKPGDLLFFTGRNAGSSTVGHIAMVVSNKLEELKMVHATNGLGVIEENLFNSSYFVNRFLFAIRPDWKKWTKE